MDDCKDFEELLSLYADGALDEQNQTLVEQHVANCPHCAALLDEYLALSQALASCAVQAPEGFADKVMDAVAKEKNTASGRGVRLGRIAPFVGIAAAAVLCISVAGSSLVRFVIRHTSDSDFVKSPTEGGYSQDLSGGAELDTEYENPISRPSFEEITIEPPTAENAPADPELESPEPEATQEKDEAVDDGNAEQITNEAAKDPIETMPETAKEATEMPEMTAPEEQKPSYLVPDTQGNVQDTPDVEADSAAGPLAQALTAVIEFFASLLEDVKHLFGGAHE